MKIVAIYIRVSTENQEGLKKKKRNSFFGGEVPPMVGRF